MIIGVLALSLVGCADADWIGEEEEVQEDNNDTVENWEEYENTRFGYVIDLPRDWTTGERFVADNGDGITLFEDNQDVEISVYAANIVEGISEPYATAAIPGLQRLEKVLDGGQEATIFQGENEELIHYEMVVVENGIEYHFVSRMTQEFYDENRDVLEEAVNSFKILENDQNEPEENKADIINKFTKELAFNLEEKFFDRAIQETGEGYLVKDYQTRMKLRHDIAEITSEEIAANIVNNYYSEDKGGLYLIPKDAPAKLIPDESIEISKINDQRVRVTQEGENQLYGQYVLEIEYTYEDEKWIVESRELTEL